MNRLNGHSVGLAFGSFAALVHLVWGIVIALGFGQALVDFCMGLHLVQMTVTVGAFNAATVLGLIILTFIGGYVFGQVLSYFWNLFHK